MRNLGIINVCGILDGVDQLAQAAPENKAKGPILDRRVCAHKRDGLVHVDLRDDVLHDVSSSFQKQKGPLNNVADPYM